MKIINVAGLLHRRDAALRRLRRLRRLTRGFGGGRDHCGGLVERSVELIHRRSRLVNGGALMHRGALVLFDGRSDFGRGAGQVAGGFL